jgi:hypothetical protein
MRTLKAVCVLLGIALVLGWFMAMANLGVSNMDEWYTVQDSAVNASIPACTDDSGANYPCYWDADAQGNGGGKSFTVDATGRTYYWEDYQS